ncbi:MAG TPA: hypothetical protein VNL96_09535 [Gemmatimonadaceae bacterium]|nr:hypothetical protein [Gemmatimonadaceae bacterium]
MAAWCNGHNGDSEAIILDVTYDYGTQHWGLTHAHVSAHEHYHHASPNAMGFASVIYPEDDGGYPAIYVSQKKHANYYDVSSCNSGGPYVSLIGREIGTDDCSLVNTAVRLEWSKWWNVGSNVGGASTQLVDCIESRNPSYEYYGSGRLECYWTPIYFRGWVPNEVGGGEATTPYAIRLQQFGF